MTGLVSGCSPKIVIELYNNTVDPLIVRGCKLEVSVALGKMVDLNPSSCSEWIQITNGVDLWRYQIWLPTHNTSETGKYYYHDHRWNLFNATLTVRLQMNPDHNVFVLPKGMNFPAKEDIPQPLGFPWVPQPVKI